jgi:hypothetical protein
MFNQTQRPPGAKDGVLQRGIATLGAAIGVACAIIFTPPLFSAFRVPLLTYLAENYGRNVGSYLALAMAVVTAIVIYVLVKLVIVLSVTWSAAALAARRFPGT